MMIAAEGLNILANKEPVVATHVGAFDYESAKQTYHRYHSETTTFVVSPDIQRYQRQFVQTVLENQTTIACLVAPFGYGKTSTAISVWKSCEEAGLLAVPPFSCNSIAEMGQSIATALMYRLEQDGQTEAVAHVQEAFEQYLTSSAQKLAEQDAERYGIDIDVALQSIEDKIKNGYLQLEASATHLLHFLEQLVAIALNAGFKGLVVIVDEFQQFLGNINKGVITNFRTLIWGLQTRGALPLGFLITMDPDTERNLTDRGADILHRIRNHGLYLSFSDIYTREFPRELWSRYAEAFSFVRESQHIVDHATLEAIGQICERSDLSNGPRTVINIFQRIATLHSTRSRSYTPCDLIDDFLTGDIRFDGDRGKIASLVNEISSYDYIKRSPSRVETIKLIAAYPRGCPPEVAERYGLHETYEYLFDELRGEILVELPEGVALVDLQKVGKPQNKLNIILKKYWLQITEAEIISDKALQYFAEYGVKPLFPEFTSYQNGWQPETDRFLLTSSGGYFRVYSGTFFEEYPQRRIAVQVVFNADQIVEPEGYADAQYVFLIQKDEESHGSVSDNLDHIPTFVIPIPIHTPFSRQLPRDIREIESFLSPVILTPGVLISLLNYITEQIPRIEGMSEQEHQRILDVKGKLQEFLLNMSLSDETFAPYEIKIFSRGVQAFRDTLFNVLRRRYPQYQTVVNSTTWKRTLEQYRSALEQITGAQRRGIDPLNGKKTELALLFGQRQYAGFESYVKQFNGLVEVKDWRGDIGSLMFHRHPNENNIIEMITVENGLDEDTIYNLSQQQGYLPEETTYFIDFLLLRGYIERDISTNQLLPATTLSQDELIGIARDILEELQFTQQLSDRNNSGDLHAQVEIMLSDLQRNTVVLSDSQVRLLQYQRSIQQARAGIIKDLRTAVQNKIESLYRYKARFSEPLKESTSGLLLDTHINGAQRTLQDLVTQAIIRIEKRVSTMREAIGISLDLDTADFYAFKDYSVQLQRQTESADEDVNSYKLLLDQCSTHQDWVQLISRLKRLTDMLNVAAEITDVSILAQNLERIQWDIKQEFASEGLKQYRLIYDRFVQAISEMQNEMEMLVKLAGTRKDKHETSPNSSLLRPRTTSAEAPISDKFSWVMTNGLVDLQETFRQSHHTEGDFLHYLIELTQRGEIQIFRKGDV
jgi:hypothetical protein